MVDNLKEYLRNVVELESSIYMQEMTLDSAKKLVVLNKIIPPKLAREKSNVEKIEKPKNVIPSNEKNVWLFVICVAIAMMVMGIVLHAITGDDISIILVIGFIFFAGGVKRLKYVKHEQSRYELKLAQYYEELEIARKKDEEYEEHYKKMLSTAMDKYYEEVEIAKQNYSIASNQLSDLEQPLLDTKNALLELYNMDIIFPKYRNIIAMSTIYEYFASGRVSTLEGPDGAYNLYESELRQNIIISKLDSIIKNLEQIRENQYILYQELEKANTYSKEVVKELSQVANNTCVAAESNKVIEYKMDMVARNTKVIKWMKLING